MTLPRILILYTGGTFGMEFRKKGAQGSIRTESKTSESIHVSVPQLSPIDLKKRFLESVPELQELAECEVDILMNRDSAHIGPPEWISIANTIQKQWKKYDGVVLLHGTDTLAYTASALSFLLRPCLKPVVMTGAQRPLAALRNDARNNLISAVEIAAYGPRKTVQQVSVVFGEDVFQGNRVRKKSASDYSAFESPYQLPLAIVGTTIRYTDSKMLSPKKWAKPALLPLFSNRVPMLHLTPGFSALLAQRSLLDTAEGLVLVAFPSGTAPTHDPTFLEFLRAAKRKFIPVVVVTEGSSQPPTAHTTLQARKFDYSAGRDLEKEGCFRAGLMTPECAYVKTALILGQYNSPKSERLKRFKQLWDKNLAHEGILTT